MTLFVRSLAFPILSLLVACGGNSPAPASPEAAAPTSSTLLTPASSSAPPLGSAAAASTDSASGSPDRTPEDVRAILQKNRDKFRTCYDAARKQTPSLQGSFVIEFTLKPSGVIQDASHNKTTSEIKDDAMGACALTVLRGLAFPSSKKGMETKVSYPFGFKPGANP